ncbi:ADP-ribosylation factor GTPase-activating protein AGD3-like isoform X1 [Beta vulgaris subsp. vulgaris]|uniref:ADP-ribosylation factor GTPase-activating protein AGD3-like isoform X1 n=1 Tax=Beta vulgaris subsp. vulgaris TaxID=3555 RepID=UPI002546D22E|nr:ADP-ribosylation factor GTPase-activating protein AGD3-like isoform X1 [Beta vulgaris subsp. vulgaris]
MLEILLQYGANVKTSDTRGQPPLHRCILKGKASAARLPLTSLSKFISTYVLRACTMVSHNELLRQARNHIGQALDRGSSI